MILLNTWTLQNFDTHLRQFNLIDANDSVESFAIAGEGNMNFTYRVNLRSKKSLIAKQSPPFCAKFPQIPAPKERIFAERNYYHHILKNPFLSQASPQILAFDSAQFTLYLEDLGQASDFESLYSFGEFTENEGKFLTQYLSELHGIPTQSLELTNSPMRELNHDYIFTLPFESESNFDLDLVTPGLNQASKTARTDPKIKKMARALGQIYLFEQSELIHGDYYPRSWIKTRSGTYVIDPEFGHLGKKEFDLGVFLAHLALSGKYRQGFELLKKHYTQFEKIDLTLLTRFCAVEILRRLLFVAQLPVQNSLEFKTTLIDAAVGALLSGDPEAMNHKLPPERSDFKSSIPN